MAIVLISGVLIIYVGIAWVLKRAIWNRASTLKSENWRLFWKAFYVALVATPSVTPTFPFSIPLPAIIILTSGVYGLIFDGFEFWRYYLIDRVFYFGIVPILIVSVIGFGLAKFVVRIRVTDSRI